MVRSCCNTVDWLQGPGLETVCPPLRYILCSGFTLILLLLNYTQRIPFFQVHLWLTFGMLVAVWSYPPSLSFLHHAPRELTLWWTLPPIQVLGTYLASSFTPYICLHMRYHFLNKLILKQDVEFQHGFSLLNELLDLTRMSKMQSSNWCWIAFGKVLIATRVERYSK